MLIVFVFGTSMVKTDLAYESLDACLHAEEYMRKEYARVYNAWLEWAQANPNLASYPKSKEFIWKRNGMETTGTDLAFIGWRLAS